MNNKRRKLGDDSGKKACRADKAVIRDMSILTELNDGIASCMVYCVTLLFIGNIIMLITIRDRIALSVQCWICDREVMASIPSWTLLINHPSGVCPLTPISCDAMSVLSGQI